MHIKRNKLAKIIFLGILFIPNILSDSFQYNSYNNHGVVGLINMPTARFFNESVHGVTIYDGTPDQKITMTSFPYDWMEASFFYTKMKNCINNKVIYNKQNQYDYKSGKISTF